MILKRMNQFYIFGLISIFSNKKNEDWNLSVEGLNKLSDSQETTRAFASIELPSEIINSH